MVKYHKYMKLNKNLPHLKHVQYPLSFEGEDTIHDKRGIVFFKDPEQHAKLVRELDNIAGLIPKK